MKVADPRPGVCSCCYGAGGEKTRFVDFEVFYDGMPVVDGEGKLAIVPGIGEQYRHDALYLCDSCVRQAAEVLAFKPELHRRQLQEIRRLELEVEHWRQYARRQEDALKLRDEIVVRVA